MERSRALGSAAVGAGGADGSGRWDSNPRRGSPKDPALAAELLPDAAEGYHTAAGARLYAIRIVRSTLESSQPTRSRSASGAMPCSISYSR